jgi:membrane-bound inhibitor of C-type lysozyme
MALEGSGERASGLQVFWSKPRAAHLVNKCFAQRAEKGGHKKPKRRPR